jgi:hypothetical protein
MGPFHKVYKIILDQRIAGIFNIAARYYYQTMSSFDKILIFLDGGPQLPFDPVSLYGTTNLLGGYYAEAIITAVFCHYKYNYIPAL